MTDDLVAVLANSPDTNSLIDISMYILQEGNKTYDFRKDLSQLFPNFEDNKFVDFDFFYF